VSPKPSQNGPRAVVRELRAGRRWLLASHENPDGDAVGALIGLGLVLEEAGLEVCLYNSSGVPASYAFLPGSERLISEISGPLDFDGLIILDSGDPERIGPLWERRGELPLIMNIDHHSSTRPWGRPRWVDTGYSAVGEMIHALAPLLPARISPQAAQNLYTAIMTDTGSFRYSNTSPGCLAAAAELVELGADPSLAAREVYLTFTPGRLALLARALESLELLEDGRIGLMRVSLAAFKDTGTGPEDLDGFADYARGLKGVEVAAIMRQVNDGYKFSLRSAGRVDVAALAAQLGGGGHVMAAGGFVQGDEEEALAAFLQAARRTLDG